MLQSDTKNIDWNASFIATRNSLRREVILRLYSEGEQDFDDLVEKTQSDPKDLANHMRALRPLITVNDLGDKYGLNEVGMKAANLLLLEEAVMKLGIMLAKKK